MRHRWVILVCMLVLGSVRASEAAPLDSPDTVYVDGKPCNKLCQSYTAWFRQLSSAPARRPPKAGVRHVTGMGGDRSKPTLLTGSTASETDPVRASVKDKHVTVGAPANFKNRQPVAAAEKTAAASPKDADHLVGLLMVGPEIKSVSDLTGKNIAIDDKQSASTGNVQRAIAAAGAAEVQLSADQAKAVDRLISGEVSAAVLTLAYPETAEWSREIAGFKVFRIPQLTRLIEGTTGAHGQRCRRFQRQNDKAANRGRDRARGKVNGRRRDTGAEPGAAKQGSRRSHRSPGHQIGVRSNR